MPSQLHAEMRTELARGMRRTSPPAGAPRKATCHPARRPPRPRMPPNLHRVGFCAAALAYASVGHGASCGCALEGSGFGPGPAGPPAAALTQRQATPAVAAHEASAHFKGVAKAAALAGGICTQPDSGSAMMGF